MKGQTSNNTLSLTEMCSFTHSLNNFFHWIYTIYRLYINNSEWEACGNNKGTSKGTLTTVQTRYDNEDNGRVCEKSDFGIFWRQSQYDVLMNLMWSIREWSQEYSKGFLSEQLEK